MGPEWLLSWSSILYGLLPQRLQWGSNCCPCCMGFDAYAHEDPVCELHYAPQWVSRSYNVVVGNEVCNAAYLHVDVVHSYLINGAVLTYFQTWRLTYWKHCSSTQKEKVMLLQRCKKWVCRIRTKQDSHEASDGQNQTFSFSQLRLCKAGVLCPESWTTVYSDSYICFAKLGLIVRTGIC